MTENNGFGVKENLFITISGKKEVFLLSSRFTSDQVGTCFNEISMAGTEASFAKSCKAWIGSNV